jgi:maleate isomerase
VSPYPAWLAEHAHRFWTASGFDVAAIRSVSLKGDNVHAIYELTSADALRVARQLDARNLDAIVFTGTGMPTLGAIEPLHADTNLPVLSSNLCLMSVLARRLGLSDRPLLALPDGLAPASL